MSLSTNRRKRGINFRRLFPRTLTMGLTLTAGLMVAVTGRAQTNLEMVLHSFTNSPDGAQPVGSLVLGSDNALYGTTIVGGSVSSTGGTLFTINLDGSGYKTLHNFSSTDTTGRGFSTPPYPLLTVAHGADGALYGTTFGGGTNGDGAVFKINADGSSYTVIHSFDAADGYPTSLIQGRDGELYGTGEEAVFRLDPSGSNYTVLHLFTNNPDGNAAFGKLTQAADGTFYGTTFFGGTNGSGTLYKFNADGNGYTVLHHFGSSPDGSNPYAGVAQGADGAIYGTASHGGTNSGGIVFKLNPDGSGYEILHTFGTADGEVPLGGVIPGSGNVIYGVTTSGGSNAKGTLFSLTLDGGTYDVLYNFGDIPDAARPYASLVAGPAFGGTGVLYGTTPYGGSAGYGSIFALLVNPPLTITSVSGSTATNQTVVFWPAWALNYVLQTTTNLTSGTWTTVSNAVRVTGVQLTNSSPSAFYRLVRP